MSTTLDQQRTTSTAGPARIRTRRWLILLVAAAVAVVTWAVAVPLLDVDLAVRPGGGAVGQISLLAVVVTSLLAGLAGWLLLALLEKWTTRAGLVWRAIAAVVLVVSLLGPLSAVNPAATAVLLGLHVLVGGILIWGLPRRQET
jgi:hypothetical protein